MKAAPLAAIAAAIPASALAHPGHWAEAGGHDHWIALGALGLAGLLTLGALVRARRRREDDEAEAEPEDAEAEA